MYICNTIAYDESTNDIYQIPPKNEFEQDLKYCMHRNEWFFWLFYKIQKTLKKNKKKKNFIK